MWFSIVCAAITALCALLGAAAGWLFGRRQGEPPDEGPELDAEAEAAIADAALRWATARGRPWLAPLVADKLRAAERVARSTRRHGLRPR